MTQLNVGHETKEEIEATQDELLEPNHRVLVHNDDVTPYDFVIVVLQRFFQRSPLAAEHITYVAHTEGQAHVVTLPLTEARKQVGKAHFAAFLEGFPLLFTIEPE